MRYALRARSAVLRHGMRHAEGLRGARSGCHVEVVRVQGAPRRVCDARRSCACGTVAAPGVLGKETPAKRRVWTRLSPAPAPCLSPLCPTSPCQAWRSWPTAGSATAHPLARGGHVGMVTVGTPTSWDTMVRSTISSCVMTSQRSSRRSATHSRHGSSPPRRACTAAATTFRWAASPSFRQPRAR